MAKTKWGSVPVALAALALAACNGDGTGAKAPGQVQIRFGVGGAGAAANAAAPGVRFATSAAPLVVAGANGTLSITGIHVVVSRLQLKGAEPCAPTDSSAQAREGEAEGGDDACDFRAGPFFLDVPLDGSQLTVATGTVPAGTYDRVRFKVENLDLNDDDDTQEHTSAGEQAVQLLFAQIRAQFPDWPQRASLLVTGTFTPTTGAARDFRAFLRAELKLELPINPPLTVGDASAANSVSVLLDPAGFFRSGTNVIDLSQFNGTVGEFEQEAGHGFKGEGHHGNDDGSGHDGGRDG